MRLRSRSMPSVALRTQVTARSHVLAWVNWKRTVAAWVQRGSFAEGTLIFLRGP